jgi:glyoxylase-like metal-dependent hydrolase (beta-lactamase superfamily II)
MTMQVESGIHRIVVGKSSLPGQYQPNTWLIIGDKAAALVDTGFAKKEHISERLAIIRNICTVPLVALVITHRHHDHSGGAGPLREATGAPIVAHSVELEYLEQDEEERKAVKVDIAVEGGEVLDLGGLNLHYIHAPGHTLGSIVIFVPERGALFTGDNVLGMGSTVVMPDQGNMKMYLHSLRKMIDLEPRVIYPGHGPTVPNAVAKLERLIQHREEREQQIVETLHENTHTLDSLRNALYPELHEHLHSMARSQLKSHLIKLANEHRVHLENDTYSLIQ